MSLALKIFKWIAYFVGGLAAFVIVLFAALNVLLQTGFFTNYVLGKVLPGVGESIGADIGVKKLRLSILPLSVLIEGAHFTPAEGEYKHQFASLDRLFLDVKTTQLLRGRVVVERLEIQGVTNYLLIDKDGLANLPIKSGPEEPEKPKEEDSGPLNLKLPIVVEDFRLKDSEFYMDMPESKMELGIKDINVHLAASMEDGNADAQVVFQDGFFEIKDVISEKLTSLEIDAIANIHDWTAIIKKFEVRIPGISLDGTAQAKNLMDELEADTHIALLVDAAKAQQFVKDPKITGDVNLEADAKFGMPKAGMTYSADGQLSLHNVKVNNLPINLSTGVYVDTETAEIKGLTGKIGEGAINLYARLGLKDDMPLSAKLSLADLDVKDAAAKYGLEIPMAGKLTADLESHGSLARKNGGKNEKGEPATELALGAKGNVSLDGFAMGDGAKRIVALPKVNLALDAFYGGTKATISALTLTTAHNTIDLQGFLDTKGPMDLELTAALDDMAEFSPVTGKPVAGKGQLSAKAKGSLKDPDVLATLNFSGLKFDKFVVDEITGTAGLDGKNATFDSLTVRAGGSRLKVTGGAFLGKPMKLNAKVEIPNGDIKDFTTLAGMADLDASGRIDLDVDVTGPLDGLEGKAVFRLDDVKAFGEHVKEFSINSRMEKGVVLLDDLRIVKLAPPRSELALLDDDVEEKDVPKDQWIEAVIAAKGKFDPTSGEIDLKLRTQNLNEQAIDTVRKQNLPLMADMNISADISGSLKDPKVKAKIELLKARYGDFILGDSIITANVENQLAKVHADLLANRWSEKIKPSQEGWVIVEHEEDAKDLPLISDTEADEDDPETLSDDFDAEVSTKATVIREKGEFGALTLDLDAQLNEGKDVTGKLVFNQFDYSGFLGSLKDKDTEDENGKSKSVIEGKINGKVDITGTLEKAAEMLIAMNLDELYFRKNDFQLRNQDQSGRPAPIKATVQGKDIRIQQFILGGNGVDLRIEEGTVAGKPGLKILGDINLAVAKEFTSTLAESKGTLKINAAIPKDFKPAGATAHVTIDNGLFDVQKSPTAIEDFNFDLTFNNGRANINTLNAKVGGGVLTGEGSVSLDMSGAEKPEPPEIKLIIKLNDIKTGIDPYLEAAVRKVSIIVTDRAKGGIDVSGEVVIDKAVYSQDIDFFTILKSFQSTKKTTGATTFKEKKENVFFNIAVRADENVGFQNNFADIETRLDLIVAGSNANPAILGTVEVIKGHATVLKNDYKVTRGVINFFEEDRIYPNFDINVETQINDVLVYLVISGTPDNVKISPSSDPPMSDRDIITLLALGVSYEQFQAGGTGIGGEEAAALAANQLVGGQLKTLTGENLDIGVDSAAGKPRLKVRSELEKDLYFTIFRGISDANLSAELEYDFLRYLGLVGSWDNLAGYDDASSVGAFGAGLKVKIDFR